MLVKIIGAVMVCASCSMIGFYYSLKGNYRIADLLEMKKAVLILKSEIEYALSPLPEALKNISARTGKEIGHFFDVLSNKLSAKDGEEIFTIWKEAMGELRNTHLTKADMDSFEQMGRTLGYLDKNLQLGSIELTIQYIDEKTMQLQAENAKTKKMYRGIGAIAGFIVTIVLL